MEESPTTERAGLKSALLPLADSYHSLVVKGERSGCIGLLTAEGVSLGLWLSDLQPLYELFERMVAEDGGSRS